MFYPIGHFEGKFGIGFGLEYMECALLCSDQSDEGSGFSYECCDDEGWGSGDAEMECKQAQGVGWGTITTRFRRKL
jgi:hypothetical protein